MSTDLYLPFLPLILVLGYTIISVITLVKKVLDGFPDSEESPIPHYFATHHSRQAERKKKEATEGKRILAHLFRKSVILVPLGWYKLLLRQTLLSVTFTYFPEAFHFSAALRL